MGWRNENVGEDAFGTGRADRKFVARVVPRKKGGRRRRGRQSDGTRALKAVKNVSRLLVQPRNYVDLNQSAISLSAAWQFTNITQIAEGDDQGTRSGREVTVTMLNIRGGISSADTSTAPQRCRLIIFRDNENAGAVPGVTDVFVGTAVDALMNYSTTNMGRFTMLYDRYFVLSKGSSTGEAGVAFTWSKKLKARVQFSGTLATDEGKGVMYIGYCVDTVATTAPVITVNVRTWFTE